jgi:hypothetical protein
VTLAGGRGVVRPARSARAHPLAAGNPGRERLPRPIATHTVLLAALAHLQRGTDIDVDQLAFAGRLAAADPEAAADLVAFLTNCPEPDDGEG